MVDFLTQREVEYCEAILNSDDIYPLQLSEILDLRTCNYCLSIDGRIIEKDDAFGKNTIFHSYCRGICVAIMHDEEDPPSGHTAVTSRQLR